MLVDRTCSSPDFCRTLQPSILTAEVVSASGLPKQLYKFSAGMFRFSTSITGRVLVSVLNVGSTSTVLDLSNTYTPYPLPNHASSTGSKTLHTP